MRERVEDPDISVRILQGSTRSLSLAFGWGAWFLRQAPCGRRCCPCSMLLRCDEEAGCSKTKDPPFQSSSQTLGPQREGAAQLRHGRCSSAAASRDPGFGEL